MILRYSALITLFVIPYHEIGCIATRNFLEVEACHAPEIDVMGQYSRRIEEAEMSYTQPHRQIRRGNVADDRIYVPNGSRF